MAPEPRLQLKLLGGFDARFASGVALDIAARKTRALLAYLALSPGRVHSREKLAALLWSDRGDKQAHASLRQALVELTRALGTNAPALIKDRDKLALDRAAIEVDAMAFEPLAESNDLGDLRRAAELYAGDLLDGIGVHDPVFEEWLLVERQRVRNLALAALGRLLMAETGQRAIHVAQRLLTLDPLQEESHRALMRLHAEAGEIGLALRQYELCREILKRELDTEPSPETELLHREIRRRSRDDVPRREREATNPATPIQPLRPLAGPSSKPSLVVLPFRNLSSDPNQQCFSDGITEDVITELSRFRSLIVIGRHSSFREQFFDLSEIEQKLGVEYVVEGSVGWVGDQIRITARLSDAGSGGQLWAERYVRERRDVFAVQDEVARTIVATLSGRLEDAGAERARHKHAGSLAAYDCLFRAMSLHNRMTDQDEARAREMLLKALDLDPEFALAHAWLAISYMVDWFEYESREAFDNALVLARRAVALDEDDGRCHATLGYVSNYHRLFEQAAYHMDRAVALTPNDFNVISGRGMLLAYTGRPEEAVEWLSTAFRLNPYPPEWHGPCKGMALYVAQRYAEAVTVLEGEGQACSIWKGMYLAASLARLGRLDEAKVKIKEASIKRPGVSVIKYAANEPYKDASSLDHLLDVLRKVGLPD